MAPRSTSYPEWYESRRPALSRGWLWLDGREPGRPDPAGFDRARLRILICRLSPYDDVLASITHRVLLNAARAVPGTYADLAFFPPEADAAVLRRDGVPFWLATGAKRAPADFDVVAVSLSVQQEAIHLPAALRESGLRLDHAGRMADARHPLVALGGHGAGSAAFLHGDAAGPGSGGLVDAVCLGDGIEWLQEFLRRWMAGKPAGLSKPDFLAALARELPGTYVPALYRHDVRDGRLLSIAPRLPGIPMPAEFRQDPLATWLRDYDGAYIPFSEEETEETLPLAAGCAYRCRFCQTGWMRRTLSAASREALLAAAARLKAAMANSDLNLLASDACSVPGLDQIVEALGPLFRRVSVKSLSVASLVRRPESFRLLRQLAKREFTFGVEGVSARLRAYLGKPAAAADLVRIAEALAAGGLRQLKLFFIATGLEDERDRTELELLLKALRAKLPACRIVASFMPLFHAPFTPLQFAPLRTLPADAERTLASAVRAAGAEFRWSAYPDEIALMNRLCRAGRGATPALVRFSVARGMRYYGNLKPDWVREFANALPDDPEEKNLQSVFPWSDVQAAADAPTLWRAYQKAREDLQAPPEPASAARAAPLRRGAPAAAAPAEPERVSFWARIPPEHARHPDHAVARSLFAKLFAEWPPGAAAYLGAPRILRPPGTSGWALVSAEFKRGAQLPAKSEFLERADVPEALADSLLFGVHWPGVQTAETVLRLLKRGRIKFQTVRQGSSRWHVVERAFRGKTGVAALREDGQQTWLYCRQRPALLENVPELLSGPAGAVQCLLAPADAPRPVGHGPACRTLKSSAPEETPACFDCLAKPAGR